MAAAGRGTVGTSVRRKEDGRLLTGAGCYVGDLALPGTAHAAFVRCPHAHARLRAIDLAAARALPGVLAVVDGAAAFERLGPLPSFLWKVPGPVIREAVHPIVKVETEPLMAVDRARFAGEAVAVVLAESRYLAEDAAERVVVDYEPLPAVTDVAVARQADAPLVHPEWGDNLAVHVRVAAGDVAGAFARAACVVSRLFTSQRLTGVPLETRGTVARPEPDGGLTVWSSTQTPHALRDVIAGQTGLDAERIRVIAPDVGGGFGIKALVYPEEVVIAWLALEHGRPVQWLEDRHEHFLSAIHSRDQEHAIELALAADGTLLALRDHFTIDMGAYNPLGLVQPYNSAVHLIGPYRVPAVEVEAAGYVTNRTPLAPYRGAGRPEAVFAMDRALDVAAHELGIDPAELRRRNMVTAAEMPYDVGVLYRDGQPLVYDSGDYHACLEQALALVGYDAVRREQAALWARGVYRGVGLSCYVEGTGIGPFEGGRVAIDVDGHVWVYTGACSQGQGHETTFAQVAADQLAVGVDQVTVVAGDTAGIARGWGTLASRSAAVAGTAIAGAAQDVGARLRELAAELLEASPADLELHAGTVRVVGTPSRSATFAELVAGQPTPPAPPPAAGRGEDGQRRQPPAPPFPRREGGLGGLGPHAPEHAALLEATRYFEPPTVTYANAVHAAVVDVDAETGAVRLHTYVVVHDCGRVINPLIVEGQIVGGVAQGIGGALLEELRYDENGQLLTASLMDYLLPTSEEMPAFALGHVESPSPRNPLGLKGLGEGGAISPPAAIANAVEDALRPFGVEVTATPLTPERVRALIDAARPAAAVEAPG
jgi:carbon-monoxide dehydrogenase large subunit